MNYLEQLAAEWYSFSGYFVRTNVPEGRELVHIELSSAADSWDARKTRFMGKKFVFNRTEYEQLLSLKIERLTRIAVVGYGRTPTSNRASGNVIKVKSIPEFFEELISYLRKLDPAKQTVPEGFPILRIIQTVAYMLRRKGAV
jgi:hypothetical protein